MFGAVYFGQTYFAGVPQAANNSATPTGDPATANNLAGSASVVNVTPSP